jgi:Flp pilus assembly protein TadB
MNSMIVGLLAAATVVLSALVISGVRPALAEGVVRRRLDSLVVEGLEPDRTLPREHASTNGVLFRNRWMQRVADRKDRDRDLPEFVDQIIRSLRSGESLPRAIRSAAATRTADDHRQLVADLDAGEPVGEAITKWSEAAKSPLRDLAAVALGLAATSGGSVATVLGGVSESLRERIALEREVRALSSQARASAMVMIIAPIGFAFVGASADSRVATLLLTRPLGWACLIVGIGLNAIGGWWMSRMIAGTK